MRVAICWSQISGYMAACWKALDVRKAVDLQIVAFKSGQPGTNATYQDNVVEGLPIHLLNSDQRDDVQFIHDIVIGHRPDIVVIPGWFHQPYFNLIRSPKLPNARFIMGMDTPWRATLRQRLGRFYLARYLREVDFVVVSGERSWQYASNLGVPETRLRRGLYGVDYQEFSRLFDRRSDQAMWPKSFLYTGRYSQVKGIDILLDAYNRYRSTVPDPWPLTMCGQGTMKGTIGEAEGITDMGFVQPADLLEILTNHGTLIQPSRYDPWPLAIVEGAAAGLPIICTEACGSAIELVRNYYNGVCVPAANPERMAAAMRWMHSNHSKLGEFGQRSRRLAAAYSAELWADRWLDMCLGPN